MRGSNFFLLQLLCTL